MAETGPAIEISALNIFDNRELKRLPVVNFSQQNRDRMDAGALGSPPTPFTSDNFPLQTSLIPVLIFY